jgi:glycosyltransferase involved in cell wall biosynthesis
MRSLCLVSPKFCNYIGGMETHSYEFAKHYRGDETHRLCAIYTKPDAPDGIAVPGMERVLDSMERMHSPWANLVKPTLSGDFNDDANRMIAETDPTNTTYFLNSPTWTHISPFIKRQCPSAKVIIRSGGNDIVAGWSGDEQDKSRGLEETRNELVSSINQWVDHFIVNSDYSYRRTVEVGVNPAKIVKSRGGVDCSEFYPNESDAHHNPLTIITSGRLVKFKGLEYSIDAFRSLCQRTDMPTQFIIVGDGPERQRLEAHAKDLCGSVVFTGAKCIAEMPDYFRKADIFLHLPIHEERVERGSSYIHTETMGRSVCEATAAGIPLVVSAVGGVPEMIVDGKSGFIVPERDSALAADRLYLLASSPELRRTMGANARARAVECLDWNRIFACYNELFE